MAADSDLGVCVSCPSSCASLSVLSSTGVSDTTSPGGVGVATVTAESLAAGLSMDGDGGCTSAPGVGVDGGGTVADDIPPGVVTGVGEGGGTISADGSGRGDTTATVGGTGADTGGPDESDEATGWIGSAANVLCPCLLL